jgi:diguanylate cyclase (GGDEF)-like protein/PAS domain S-box-containing protein
MTSTTEQQDQTVARAAEALLREHPDALVCALSNNGLIVPLPGTVQLWGQAALEGRAVIDAVVAADRAEVVSLWNRLEQEHAVKGKVRMLSRPSRWVTLHFIDLTGMHGVRLCVVLPSDEEAAGEEEEQAEVAAAPRFATLLEDEGAKVLECDEAFTEMFGYTAEELIGESVLDQIHPDDQGRAVEGWITALATRRDQLTRLRRRRRDGSYVWVDTTLHNYLNEPGRNYVLVELIDVSAEMAAQEALQEREELLRRLTDAMPVGLMQLDRERNVVYHNARLGQIVQTPPRTEPTPEDGASAGEHAEEPADRSPTSARSLLSTLTHEGMASFEAALSHVLDEGVDEDVEVDIVLAGGEWRRALMSIRALVRGDRGVGGAIICALDVTDSARAHRELERRATFDSLTGCYNRAAILELLERELAREDDDAGTGVVYVDLDGFKSVNDSLGHAAGDELLAAVAERLRAFTRRDDTVGRLGGDEFLIVLPGARGNEVAMRVAERVCGSMRKPIDVSAGTVELSASVGVACAKPGAMDADELVRRADAAMYCSKERSRGTATLDEPRPPAPSRRHPPAPSRRAAGSAAG